MVGAARERRDDIPLLAANILEGLARDLGQARLTISCEAERVLCNYDWPGNIRELRNVVERALLLCHGDAILPSHLPLEKMRATLAVTRAAAHTPLAQPVRDAAASSDPTIRMPVLPPDAGERERVLAALAACNGNQSAAAQMLGIARRTLINKIERYGIERPRKKPQL